MPEFSVPADATLEEVRDFFKKDRYATLAGAVIEEARPGFARLSLKLDERHLNGFGALMGGVSLTMADYAFAVASNIGMPATVSTNMSSDFLGTPKTDELVITCTVEKSGRTLCFATSRVEDSEGHPVLRANITGLRKS